MQTVIVEGEANVVDLPIGADDDAVEMIGDHGIGAASLAVFRGGLVAEGRLAQEGLGIELPAADMDIDLIAGEVEGEILQLGLVQGQMPEAGMDELSCRVETAIAIAGEVARLEAEIGDGDRMVALQGQPYARPRRRAGGLVPFGEVDRRGGLGQVEIERHLM